MPRWLKVVLTAIITFCGIVLSPIGVLQMAHIFNLLYPLRLVMTLNSFYVFGPTVPVELRQFIYMASLVLLLWMIWRDWER